MHALAGRQSRRITPTSLVTPQSGSVWTSGHSHGWADNPAFISPIPTSNSWKAQSEDRQLLHEQLRKQKRTNPSRPHHSGDPTSSRPHHSGDPTSSRPHHSGDPTSSRPHHSGDPTSSRPHHSGDPTSSRPHHSGDPTSSRPHHSGDSTSSRPHHSGDPTSSRPHHSGDPTSSRPHHSGDKQIIRGAQNCAEPPEGGPVKVVTGGVTNITAGGVADVPEEGMLLEEATLSEDDKKDIKEFAWGYSALLRKSLNRVQCVYVSPRLCMCHHDCVCVTTTVYVSPRLCMCHHDCVCVTTTVYVSPRLCMCHHDCVCGTTTVYVYICVKIVNYPFLELSQIFIENVIQLQPNLPILPIFAYILKYPERLSGSACLVQWSWGIKRRRRRKSLYLHPKLSLGLVPYRPLTHKLECTYTYVVHM